MLESEVNQATQKIKTITESILWLININNCYQLLAKLRILYVLILIYLILIL